MKRIIFLGTGGARVMMASQLLATGGIWLDLDGTQISLDPGPGALVHSRAKHLSGTSLQGIIISHRHLDHCGDVNAMVEAMTQGGIKKGGTIFAPHDALEEDPVVLRYVRRYVDHIITLQEKQTYALGNIKFQTSMRHVHGDAETFGFNFTVGACTISYLPDTAFFDALIDFYRGDILIICVLLLERNGRIPHLSIPEAARIISSVRPQQAILTHFGMKIWQARPSEIAATLASQTGVEVIAAQDGMEIWL